MNPASLAMLSIALLVALAAPAYGQRLMVGWAERDISPRLPVVLVGQFHARVATEIRDPLTVTALALSEGEDGDCAVLVSCDVIAIRSEIIERCREAIGESVPDLPAEKVVLSATHTHTAPGFHDRFPRQVEDEMPPAEFADLFVERVTEAVAEAWEQRRPGSVGWGYGHAVVAHNRRVVYFDGTARMYGNTDDPNFSHIEGYEDHGLDLLYTWDEAGELTGVLVNLACPSQVVGSATYVSADFWHDVRVQLRRRIGEGLFVLGQASAAGDQNSRNMVHRGKEERMLRLRGLTRREELGRRIANAVEEVLPLAQMETFDTLPLRHSVRQVHLARQPVTEEQVEAARRNLERLQAEEPADERAETRRHSQLRRAERLISRYEEQQEQPTLEYEVNAIRLGDVAFASNPFEYYLDYGLRIEARSPAQQTFIVQLAGHAGYVPTARALEGGGYSADGNNRIGAEGGQQLVEHTLEMLHELWAEEE